MIDIVTLSTNDDPMYWEFWNPVSKHWKEKFGIHPVLLYYGKPNSALSEEWGTVVYQDIIEGIPDYVAATWGRFWITKFYKDKMCIVGDIDMFPLSKEFFLINSKPFPNVYTHLNSGAYYGGNHTVWRTDGMAVPVCYHIATGDTFSKVYDFNDSFEVELKKIINTDYSEYTEGFAVNPEPHLHRASAENGGMWGIDEMYSSMMLRKWVSSGGIFATPSQIHQSDRLCRVRAKFQLAQNPNTKFVDFHSFRPYNQNKDLIHFLVDRYTA